jgi:hypothetical protein
VGRTGIESVQDAFFLDPGRFFDQREYLGIRAGRPLVDGLGTASIGEAVGEIDIDAVPELVEHTERRIGRRIGHHRARLASDELGEERPFGRKVVVQQAPRDPRQLGDLLDVDVVVVLVGKELSAKIQQLFAAVLGRATSTCGHLAHTT